MVYHTLGEIFRGKIAKYSASILIVLAMSACANDVKRLSLADREEFGLESATAILVIEPGKPVRLVAVNGEPQEVELPQEVGELKAIESIAIVTTSRSPDCSWIYIGNERHKVCD